MSTAVALDSSYIIGYIDERDLWNKQVNELGVVLVASGYQLVVFDCVMAEAISTLARRLHEKRRAANVFDILARLEQEFPKSRLTWLYPQLESQFETVIDLVKETGGELNFNDALIAISCRERNIQFLASFDPDFDRIEWLKRVSKPEDLNSPLA